MGILYALMAMLSWGGGDFLIERSSRKFGAPLALFYVTAVGSLITLPFIYKDLLVILQNPPTSLLILLLASIITLFASIIDFEALRIGKLSVVEPVYATEVFVTIVLSTVIIQEIISKGQIILVIFLMLGVAMVSLKSLRRLKKVFLEKGVGLAFLSAILMGFTNFFVGYSSRLTSPLLTHWFTCTIIAVAMLIYLWKNKAYQKILGSIKNNALLITSVGILDTLAWVSFSYSAILIPIAIATAISESYIAIAAIFGLALNKEKLKKHQKLGVFIAIISAIFLAYLSEK